MHPLRISENAGQLFEERTKRSRSGRVHSRFSEYKQVPFVLGEPVTEMRMDREACTERFELCGEGFTPLKRITEELSLDHQARGES